MRRPTPSALVACLATCLFTSSAHADVKACLDASEEGQVLRDTGKLRAAREKFVVCSHETCPGMVRSDCARWLANVDERIPEVLVRARAADGSDVVDVRILMDGVLLASVADGHFLQVDPGVHVFRFEAEGSQPVEQRVVIRERERDRFLDVTFGGAPPAVARPASPAPAAAAAEIPALSAPRPVPPLVWVLGGVGLAGLGTFAYFAATAKSDRDHLAESCAPTCSASDVTHAKTELFVANTAAVVSGAAFAAAAILYFTRPEVATKVGFQPGAGSASLFVRHAF